MPISTRTRSAFVLATLSVTGCVAGGGFNLGGKSSAGASASSGSTSSASSSSSSGGGDASPTAPDLDDFSFALKEYTGYYAKAFVTNKLMQFKVGPTCWKKMADKDAKPLHTASFTTSYVLEYAKGVTGDDWSDIESQNKEKNVSLIAPMMEDFKNQFFMTIAVEGDDCETTGDALWLRYWFQIAETIRDYPPKSGKAFITLTVTPSVKDVTVEVDPSGSQFTFTAPRDIEAKGWHEKFEKPIRRVSKKM